MQMLSALVQRPDHRGNLEALRLLCQQMQTMLKIRVVFIAECLADNDNCFRVLTCSQDGALIEASEGKIVTYEGTPCAHLKDKDVFLVPTVLQEQFPEQDQNKQHNLVSYLGLNIRDENGSVIGHFALQHDKELMYETLDSDMFQLFTSRVNLELRRYQSEQQSS